MHVTAFRDVVDDVIALSAMTRQHLRNINLLKDTTDDYGKRTVGRLNDDAQFSALQQSGTPRMTSSFHGVNV